MKLSLGQWRRNFQQHQQQHQQNQQNQLNQNPQQATQHPNPKRASNAPVEHWRNNEEVEEAAPQISENDMMSIEEFIFTLNKYEAENENTENEHQMMTIDEFILSCKEPNAKIVKSEPSTEVQDEEPLMTVEEFIYTSERRDNSNDMLTLGEFISQSSRRKNPLVQATTVTTRFNEIIF